MLVCNELHSSQMSAVLELACCLILDHMLADALKCPLRWLAVHQVQQELCAGGEGRLRHRALLVSPGA